MVVIVIQLMQVCEVVFDYNNLRGLSRGQHNTFLKVIFLMDFVVLFVGD